MPPIGLVAPGDRTLGPAHLRLDIEVAEGDDGVLRRGAAHGCPLEVALLIDDEASGLDAIAPSLSSLPVRASARPPHERGDDPGSVGAGGPRSAGEGGRQCSLRRWDIVTLLRTESGPPDNDDLDAVAFGISPTVHARDERSMMETLEIQTEIARQARDAAHGLPLVVSPVVLDAHAGTRFADAWTVGSVASLVAGGAVSLTYASPTRALAVMMGLRGLMLADVTLSQPQRVVAIAAGGSVVIANLTPDEQRIRVGNDEHDAMRPYEVRVVSVG